MTSSTTRAFMAKKQSTSFTQVATNLLNVLQGYSKTIRLLLVMFVTLSVGANVWGAEYELVSFSDIKTNDVIIIVGTKSGTAYAMTNDGGTSNPPKPSEVTISNNKITTTATDIIFTATKNDDGTLTFANGTDKLYCTATNNGVRVGTNTNNKFSFDTDVNRLKNEATTRWLGIYNTQDWRCYTSASATNISGTTTTFYRKVTAAPSHTITATSNNNSYGTVSVSGTTITATPNDGYRVKSGDAGYTVTNGTAVVTNNGDDTFTVTPSSNCTITINFEAIPKYTVTLVPGSGSVTDTELEEESAGAGVELPTPTLDCGDWEFAGWKTTSAVTTETTTEPTLIAAGAYSPTSDITLYAVYQRTETTSGGGGGGSSTPITTDDIFENGGTYTAANGDVKAYITWTEANVVSIRQEQGSSNSPVSSSYVKDPRWYASHQITITPSVNISAITIQTQESKYTTALTAATYTNATASSSSNTVTITPTNGNETITISMGSQARLYTLTVTYASGGSSTTYYHSTPECITQTSRCVTPKHRGDSGGTWLVVTEW